MVESERERETVKLQNKEMKFPQHSNKSRSRIFTKSNIFSMFAKWKNIKQLSENKTKVSIAIEV